MPNKSQAFHIGDMTYWNDGSDLGECQCCDERAVSYNENGDLFCERHLIEWHEAEEDFEDAEFL